MEDPAEVIASLFILVFGGAVVLMTAQAARGNDISGIANAVESLAGPLIVVLILLFFALSIIDAVS